MLVPLVTPLLSKIMTAPQAVGVSLPLLIVGDLFALRLYWRKWDMQHINLLVPMAILGVVVGTAVLAFLATRPDDTILRRIIGIFTLTVVIYRLIRARLVQVQYQPHHWHGYLAGIFAGIGSTLANAGAPPFTAYMLMQNPSPESFIGTASLFFAIVNIAKLPGVLAIRVLDLQQLPGIAWSVLLVPVGVGLGRWLTVRVSPQVFEWSMVGLLLCASAVLLLSPS